MSTSIRAFRADRKVIPIKFVRGTTVQHVDADVRLDKRSQVLRKLEEEEASREVRRALNAYYYETV